MIASLLLLLFSTIHSTSATKSFPAHVLNAPDQNDWPGDKMSNERYSQPSPTTSEKSCASSTAPPPSRPLATDQMDSTLSGLTSNSEVSERRRSVNAHNTLSTAPSSSELSVHTPLERIMEGIRELHNDPSYLPQYRASAVKESYEEIHRLYRLNSSTLDELDTTNLDSSERGSATTQGFQVRQGMIDRLKRCTLAYLNERMVRIRNMKWKIAGAIPADVQANMSDSEKRWVSNYVSVLLAFQQRVGEYEDGVNLTNHMYPPKTTLVQVRCVKQYGQYETCDGIIIFLRDKTLHNIPRRDAEILVRRGIVTIP